MRKLLMLSTLLIGGAVSFGASAAPAISATPDRTAATASFQLAREANEAPRGQDNNNRRGRGASLNTPSDATMQLARQANEAPRGQDNNNNRRGGGASLNTPSDVIPFMSTSHAKRQALNHHRHESFIRHHIADVDKI